MRVSALTLEDIKCLLMTGRLRGTIGTRQWEIARSVPGGPADALEWLTILGTESINAVAAGMLERGATMPHVKERAGDS